MQLFHCYYYSLMTKNKKIMLNVGARVRTHTAILIDGQMGVKASWSRIICVRRVVPYNNIILCMTSWADVSATYRKPKKTKRKP